MRLTKAQADKTEFEVAELRGSTIRSPVAVNSEMPTAPQCGTTMLTKVN
jgi:hypothetical protein